MEEGIDDIIKSYNFESRLKNVNLTENEIKTVKLAIQFAHDAWDINENLDLDVRKTICKKFLIIADSTIIAAAGRRERPKRNVVFNFFLSLFHRL